MKRIYIYHISRKSMVLYLMLIPVLALSLITIYSFWNSGRYEAIETIPTYYGHGSLRIFLKHENGGRLAIIIDDFGQSRDGVEEMLSINKPLTMAVMPFLEFSEADAKNAHDKGHEVIVHLSMEPVKGKKSWLGPNPILSGMEQEKVRSIVREAFESVPYAAGANIHMGSKASSERDIVAAILEIIKEKGLYFVDSRTSAHPVARDLADSMGVVCLERNVFLDGTKSKERIKKNLSTAGEIAIKQGQAIAIGHVGIEGGKETAQAIMEMIPEFDEEGIELVFISDLTQQPMTNSDKK